MHAFFSFPNWASLQAVWNRSYLNQPSFSGLPIFAGTTNKMQKMAHTVSQLHLIIGNKHTFGCSLQFWEVSHESRQSKMQIMIDTFSFLAVCMLQVIKGRGFNAYMCVRVWNCPVLVIKIKANAFKPAGTMKLADSLSTQISINSNLKWPLLSTF